MQQPHQQTPIMDPLDLLEQQLVTAIETCHTNTLLLKNYKRSEQQQLFSNVDKYVTTLGDIYDTASGLTNQQVRRRTLLYVFFFFFFIFCCFFHIVIFVPTQRYITHVCFQFLHQFIFLRRFTFNLTSFFSTLINTNLYHTTKI